MWFLKEIEFSPYDYAWPYQHFKKLGTQSSRRGAAETNLNRNHEVSISIPDLAQWVKDPALAMSCGVDWSCGLVLALP